MPNDNETTTRFRVDIAELKKNFQEASRQIRLANSEFKAATSGMDKWEDSANGISSKLTQLNSVLNAQRTQLSSLERQYELTVREQGETSRGAQELLIRINNQRAAIGNTERQINSYNTRLQELQNETDSADKSTDELNDSLDDLGDGANNAGNGFTVMKGALANLVAEGIQMAISAIKNLASDVMEVGKNFESSMSNVAALSGATGDELEKLEETARKYGATTQFSASEAADALGYMALAGWDANQSADSLGGVLNLAAASGMGLAEASDMVTDYLSAFGMEAKESAYFADLLSYAQANSNTTAEGLGEAFKNCAANMNAAGQDIETTSSLLAMMANQGLKGSEAGTALTAVMRDMTAKMENGAIQIGKTNVKVMDANGNYRDMTDILKDVENAVDGMGDAEKATALQSTFTSNSIKGLNLMLNAGIDEAAKFEEELRNCSGSAEEMSKVMNDNLEGDLKSMNSAYEEFALSIYENVNSPMRGIVQDITNEVLPAFTDFVKGVDGSGEKVGNSIGKLVTNIVNQLASMLPQLAEVAVGLVTSIISGLLDSLPDIIKAIVKMVKTILKSLSKMIPDIVDKIIEIIPDVIDALIDAIPDLIDAAVQFLMAIIKAIPMIIPKITAALPKIIKSIIDGLIEAIPTLIDGAIQLLMAIIDAIPLIIPPLIEAIPMIVSTLVNGLVEALPVLLDGAIQLLMAIIDAIPIIIEALMPEIPHIVMTIIEVLLDNIPVLIEAAFQLFMAIVAAIPQFIVELVKNLPKIIKAILSSLIEPVKKLFSGLWDNIKKIFGPVIDFFKNIFGKAWEGIKVIWSKVGNFFGGIWNGIKNTFSKVSDWFKDVFSKAWGAVKKVFETGGKVFEGIKNGIVTTFKTVVNAIIRGINKIITIPFNAINGILNGIRSINIFGLKPFDWIGSLPVPQIPELAKGGVLRKGQIGFLEGNGAEAVVPLEKNTKWLDEIAKRLSHNIESKNNSIPQTINNNTTNNFNQNNYSPKSLSRLEIYRQSKNLLSAKGV